MLSMRRKSYDGAQRPDIPAWKRNFHSKTLDIFRQFDNIGVIILCKLRYVNFNRIEVRFSVNRRSLLSLLLAMTLLGGAIPSAASAEDWGNMSVALTSLEDLPTIETEPAIEEAPAPGDDQTEGEAGGELETGEETAVTEETTATEETSAETETAEETGAIEETPQEIYDLILLRISLENASDTAVITLLDAEGNIVVPLGGENGETLYGNYLLPPGPYSYSAEDPADGSEAPATLIMLDGTKGRVDVSVRLTPKEPEPLRVPVVFQCDSLDDFSGLAVTDENGGRVTPYTDPDTGEIQYRNYLLEPGAYRCSYHDAEGVFADLEDSFTVAEGGLQYITLKLKKNAEGLCFSGTLINPYYAGIIREEYLPEPETSPEESLSRLMSDLGAEAVLSENGRSITAVFAAEGEQGARSEKNSPVVYENAAAAGAALKRKLLQRQHDISIRIRCKAEPSKELWWNIAGLIYDEAIRHSGVSTEGDYLRYEYGGVKCTGSTVGPDAEGDYYYEYVYAPLYFTTLAQETELTERVGAVLGSLALNGKSDEQKIRAIYNYLCDNVSYDYAKDTITFTAYDALVNGRAVCQGVAVAFYRLCLEVGVDARVVTSEEINHAWNIARADGAHYYALDATWDAENTPEEREFYLKGRTNWLSKHTLGDEFLDGRFSGYSFPEEDYDALNAAIIHSASVVFDGMLRIKYYFTLPDRLLNMPGACLQFSRNGETFQTLPLTECREEKGYRSCSCGVRADEIGIPVQVKIRDGDGENVPISTEKGYIYANGIFFSAMKYAQEMKTGSGSAAMRTLAQALEDYGVAAQSYFKGEDGELRDEVAAVDEEDLAPWRGFAEGDMPEGVKGVFLSVVFEADNSLRVYFRFESGAEPSGYAFAVDGKNAALRRKEDGSCYLSVDSIAANELDTAHSFRISDGNSEYTLTASALSYAEMSLRQGNSAADLSRALYCYNRAADAYFGT